MASAAVAAHTRFALLTADSPLLAGARALADAGRWTLIQLRGDEDRPLPALPATAQVLVGARVPGFFRNDLLLRCRAGQLGDVRLAVDGPLPRAEVIGLRWQPWLRGIHAVGEGSVLPALIPAPAPLTRARDLDALLDDWGAPPVTWSERPCAFPPRLQLQTTTACRAGCAFCPHPGADAPARTMDEGLFTALVEESGEHGAASLELYFHGEPAEDPRLPALARRAAAANPSALISITTHEAALGTIARRFRACSAGLDGVFVSVNVVGEPPAGAIRARLERVARRAAQLRAAGVSLTVTTLADLQPRGVRGRFRRRCRALELPLYVGRATTRGGDVELAPLAPPERVPRAQLPPRCPRPFAKAYVRWNGDLVACCEDWRYRRVLGNAAGDGIAAVWLGERYRAWRRDVLAGGSGAPCAACG